MQSSPKAGNAWSQGENQDHRSGFIKVRPHSLTLHRAGGWSFILKGGIEPGTDFNSAALIAIERVAIGDRDPLFLWDHRCGQVPSGAAHNTS